MQTISILYRLIAVVLGTIVLGLTTAAPLDAATIVSTIDVLGGYDSIGTSNDGAVRAAEAAWSPTGTFVHVSVAAEIDPDHNVLPITSHTVSGTAFLMTQVGPGTTTANQVASTSFTVTGTAFSPTLVTLFTGLTLGPGTYHLVLSAPADQSAGWDFALFPSTAVTAPGVTLVDGNLSGIQASYPPATNLNSSRLSNGSLNMVIIMSGAPRLERTTSTQATAAMRRWTPDESLPSVRPSHERRREPQRRQPPSRSRLGQSTDLIGPVHLRPFAG